MSRLLAPALVAVGLCSVGVSGSLDPTARVASAGGEVATGASKREIGAGLCPPGTLPDGPVCVHLPGDDEGVPELTAVSNAHHDKKGRWTSYDHIPRRPDRPADYDAYRYPVPPRTSRSGDLPSVVSGYDLDRPDEAQRRGRRLSHVGHGGVDLPHAKGTPVTLVPLEHQQGDAEVLYVGPLFGTTVVTRHVLREGGRLRDYVVLFGHLDAPAPGLARGSTLKEGDLVGFVGDTGSPELVHLHLEVRRVREEVDVSRVSGAGLVAHEVSVACDPRNVLPLRGASTGAGEAQAPSPP